MPHPDKVPLSLTQDQHLKTCLRPPTPAPTPAPTIKMEDPPQSAVIPHAMVMPKQVAEKCTWGLHCPIFENKSTKWTRMATCKTNLECVPKTFSHRTHSTLSHKTLSHRIFNALSHRPSSVPNHRTINMLRHKTFSTPSHRMASNHLTFQTGMPNK